jgi:cytochrome c553
MKTIFSFLLMMLAPSLALAADAPGWAFLVTDKVQPPAAPDDGKAKQMPGSAKSFTQAEINNIFAPPDWYPDEHPAAPEIVAHGSNNKIRACGTCHLMTGLGHPESANLAGLPRGYIQRQMDDFKGGRRKGSDVMADIAKGLSDADLSAAAGYFASLKPAQWTRVVETDSVPQTFVGKGNMRFALPGGTMEPLGTRIIEIPEDPVRAEARDAHSGFIAYVPKGSLAKGEALVKTGGDGKTIACSVCHGDNLRGLGEVPRIAGRSAVYLVRQLYMMQDGTRDSETAVLMKAVVKQMTLDDMIAAAAYVASREP